MPITIKDINDKVFTKQVRGYSIEEVDDFLDELAAQMETLIRENQAMARQLEEAQKAAAAAAQVQAEEAVAEPAVEEVVNEEPVVEAVAEVPAPVAAPMVDIESQYYRNLRETLMNAQRMADATVADAKQKANAMIAEAEEKAAEVTAAARAEVEAAQVECADVRTKIADYRTRFQQMVVEQVKALGADVTLFE